jgi:hypothetical protein
MYAMRLDTAIAIIAICGALIAVQLVFLTVEIAALKRVVFMLLRKLNALNEAVNPWAAENEPTDPNMPPARGKKRLSFYVPFTRKRD